MRYIRGAVHQRQISENRDTVAEAKEVRLLCPHCYGALYVTVPYGVTAERRQRLIAAAVNEHRGLCDKAPPEAQRVYRIDYPRAT